MRKEFIKGRKILAAVLALLVLASPFVFVFAYARSLPDVYSDTFYGALDEKYERLNELGDDKIVVVGGSSVAFGLDSELLERYTGMPVVNFGLYADLGTKMMLDLSLSGIKEGDVVILAPELDPQTLSLYFNNQSALMALDDKPSMARHLEIDDLISCLGGYWKYAQDKHARYTGKTQVALDEVYRSTYFDEYGDFDYVRPENVMKFYYDPNNKIALDAAEYGAELYEFFDYVNEYVKTCQGRGATVYFSYCPMNELGLTDGSSDEAIASFEALLHDSLDCEIISVAKDYILDAGYFFDTNYHLNDTGVKVRTIRLAKDLRITAGIMQGSLDDEPEAPELALIDVIYEGEDDPVSIYYELMLLPNGSYGISGLTELGKQQSVLTVPVGYNERKVTAILENAFAGTVAERIIIGADANIVIIHNGAFVGASSVKDLSVYKMNASDVMPPVDFYGAHPDFKVHVPIGSSYADHYDWSNKAQYVYDLEM